MSEDSTDPITIALEEDIGGGDITTQAFLPGHVQGHARIIAHEACVIAGTRTAAEVFRRVDPNLHIDVLQSEGASLSAGEIVLETRGAAASILIAERVALNFLQRLSGIATLTRQFVDAIGEYPTKILDTRKTTPGLRALEKAAVAAGGGTNHRAGLYDMVLVKDNHLRAAMGFSAFAETIRQVRNQHPNLRVEVEADNLEQVRAFLEIEGIDIILLDNMKPAQMREAVALGKQKVKFEASGGVTLKNVRRIAATGVDYISVGALTHSARAIDLSLEFAPVAA